LGQQVLVLLPHVEQHVLVEGLGLGGVVGLQFGDVGGQLRVELLGDVDVLVQPAHRRPELLLLHVEGHVVLGQLVLALAERVQDRVEVLLAVLVLAEVVLDRLAEREDAQDLLRGLLGLARIQVLDGAAQLEERLAHLRAVGEAAAVDLADRRLQHAVALLGGLLDVGVAHRAHGGGLRLELRRLRLLGGHRGEELVDLRVEHRPLLRGHRGRHLGGGRGRHDLRRRGRLQREDRHAGRRGQRSRLGGGGGDGIGSRHDGLSGRLRGAGGAPGGEASTPCQCSERDRQEPAVGTSPHDRGQSGIRGAGDETGAPRGVHVSP